MKNLLVVLLLIVLAAQGIAVAVGGSAPATAVAHAPQEHAGEISDAAAATDDGIGEPGQTQVAADMEEMSDYVPLELAFQEADLAGGTPRVRTPLLFSADLPPSPTPPRV